MCAISISNAAFAHAPVCSMFRARITQNCKNRRCCAGTHYVDGMMLLVKTAEAAGVIRAIAGLEKKVVLEMFSKSWELGQMTRQFVPNVGCN